LQDHAAPTESHHGTPERSVERAGCGRTPQPGAMQSRREVIAVAALATAGLCAPCTQDAVAQTSSSAPAPRMARPAPGDVVVFAAGEKAGKPIGADDLVVGAPQILAWTMEPGSGVIRNGSRLNQIALIRLDASELDEATASRSAQGIVAYSAVCTHAQCPVSEWRSEKGVLHCPCHQSEFDPKRGGKVVGGPAPRSLAALPIRTADGEKFAEGAGVANGVLVVAKPFVGRVGTSS
jgi:rieske iron-sulfur protein